MVRYSLRSRSPLLDEFSFLVSWSKVSQNGTLRFIRLILETRNHVSQFLFKILFCLLLFEDISGITILVVDNQFWGSLFFL